MSEKRIHIVSFDVPVPADYGGVLDIYLRCKALKQLGFYVILHCYEYGRGRPNSVPEIADEIHFYDRHTSATSLFSALPYIVRSRNSRRLINTLKKDLAPIILEGQHSTYWVHALREQSRIVMVRMHNVEWHYYRKLAEKAENTFQRIFFSMESRKLKRHETKLRQIPLLCISVADATYYREQGCESYVLPVTIDDSLILEPLQSKGFALFHGNLSVAENKDAVMELIRENKRYSFPYPVIIAGKNPSELLQEKIREIGWQCIPNPSNEALNELLQTCELHLLNGTQETGVKLKVIRAILTGKPCVLTQETVYGTGLQDHSIIWNRTEPLGQFLNALDLNSMQNNEDRITFLKYEHGIKRLEEILDAVGASSTLALQQKD